MAQRILACENLPDPLTKAKESKAQATLKNMFELKYAQATLVLVFRYGNQLSMVTMLIDNPRLGNDV